MAAQQSTGLAHTPALSLNGSDLHNKADRRNEDESITPIKRTTDSEIGLFYDSLLFQDTEI